MTKRTTKKKMIDDQDHLHHWQKTTYAQRLAWLEKAHKSAVLLKKSVISE